MLNEPDRANEARSYMWVYRGIGPPNQVGILFEYQQTRSGAHAEAFLGDYSGALQTDAYAGYNHLRLREGIEGYGCFAHARRKFMAIVKSTTKTGKSHEAVSTMNKLYAIERQAREAEMTSKERQALREAKAIPILEKFKRWLDKSVGQVPAKSPIGQAIAYTLRQWKYLINYVNNGEVEIDTNLLENEIRPFALGRKNWLFAGSVDGAKASAIIYSLQQTCKSNHVEPYSYFKVVLKEILDCKTKHEYWALLPQFIDREKLAQAYQ